MFKDAHSEAKAAHAAAYLLRKGGGCLEMLKLMKLMYLAERGFYAKYGMPMIGDEPFADRHGPVLNNVYRAADENNTAVWRSLIAPRDGNEIFLQDDIPPLKKLSQADRAILDAVWEEHGAKTGSQLRKWTHRNCKEYDELSFDLYAPRKPIQLRRLLLAVGFTEDEVPALLEELRVQDSLDVQLKSLTV